MNVVEVVFEHLPEDGAWEPPAIRFGEAELDLVVGGNRDLSDASGSQVHSEAHVSPPHVEWLEALPERGGCSTPDTSHPIEQWRAAARAGVFAYDWDVYSGPYQAIAVPALPVLVADLPAVFAALARRTRFAHLCFCERMTITVGDVELCALDHR